MVISFLGITTIAMSNSKSVLLPTTYNENDISRPTAVYLACRALELWSYHKGARKVVRISVAISLIAVVLSYIFTAVEMYRKFGSDTHKNYVDQPCR